MIFGMLDYDVIASEAKQTYSLSRCKRDSPELLVYIQLKTFILD